MARDPDENRGSVAMYWDFENLHAALLDTKYGDGTYARQDNRFKPQEPLVDVQTLGRRPEGSRSIASHL